MEIILAYNLCISIYHFQMEVKDGEENMFGVNLMVNLVEISQRVLDLTFIIFDL